MKPICLIAAALMCSLNLQAQQNIVLDSIIVRPTMAQSLTPVSGSIVSRHTLKAAEPSLSLPQILASQPSVVSFSEGGTGLGYTRMRVRGSDGSRINVTLNGITLNDAESQEMFWANIPAISAYAQSVQIQRGVGLSAGGSGSFGADISLQSALPSQIPYTSVQFGYGSYNTLTLSAQAGGGCSSGGFTFDTGFFLGETDGYVRNGWADVRSAYLCAGWGDADNALKLIWLPGYQHSGITWYGVPSSIAHTDPRYNPAGMHTDSEGNVLYYPNESDNYVQNHIQLLYTHSFTPEMLLSAVLHYTDGYGYYEQYRSDLPFSGENVVRQNMDNGFLAGTASFHWSPASLTVDGGLYFSAYMGKQWGEIVSPGPASVMKSGDVWYTNDSFKGDCSAYLRASWTPAQGRLSFFGDLQWRGVAHNISGTDDDTAALESRSRHGFINPKLGLTFASGLHSDLYASVSMTHREAARDDLKAASKSGREYSIRPERLTDCELGFRHKGKSLSLCANLFAMLYRDQLVNTGLISSQGYRIRENVPHSNRLGVETQLEWNPSGPLRVQASASLSRNRIKEYTAWVDTFDADFNLTGQVRENYADVPLAMSPGATASCSVWYTAACGLEFSVSARGVSRQFYDNTGSLSRSLDGWLVADASALWPFQIRNGAGHSFLSGKLTIFVNNLMNSQYAADAWVYRAYAGDGSEYVSDGLFPQAGRNVAVKLEIDL